MIADLLELHGSRFLERAGREALRRPFLAEWKLSGWERTYGRAPTSADLVARSRNLTPKDKHDAPKQLAADLELLKLRPRRGHDLRRTFITLAQVERARRDLRRRPRQARVPGRVGFPPRAHPGDGRVADAPGPGRPPAGDRTAAGDAGDAATAPRASKPARQAARKLPVPAADPYSCDRCEPGTPPRTSDAVEPTRPGIPPLLSLRLRR